MTTTALPTVEACDEALGALGELFDSLPASQRPLHVGNREDIRRLLDRIRRYVISQQKTVIELPRSPLSAADPIPSVTAPTGVSVGAVEAEPLPKGNGEHEQERSRAETKKAMKSIKEIFDAIMGLDRDSDRQELFDRLLDVCCPRCGTKSSPDDDHDCEAEDEDEDEDDEDDEDDEESAAP